MRRTPAAMIFKQATVKMWSAALYNSVVGGYINFGCVIFSQQNLLTAHALSVPSVTRTTSKFDDDHEQPGAAAGGGAGLIQPAPVVHEEHHAQLHDEAEFADEVEESEEHLQNAGTRSAVDLPENKNMIRTTTSTMRGRPSSFLRRARASSTATWSTSSQAASSSSFLTRNKQLRGARARRGQNMETTTTNKAEASVPSFEEEFSPEADFTDEERVDLLETTNKNINPHEDAVAWVVVHGDTTTATSKRTKAEDHFAVVEDHPRPRSFVSTERKMNKTRQHDVGEQERRKGATSAAVLVEERRHQHKQLPDEEFHFDDEFADEADFEETGALDVKMSTGSSASTSPSPSSSRGRPASFGKKKKLKARRDKNLFRGQDSHSANEKIKMLIAGLGTTGRAVNETLTTNHTESSGAPAGEVDVVSSSFLTLAHKKMKQTSEVVLLYVLYLQVRDNLTYLRQWAAFFRKISGLNIGRMVMTSAAEGVTATTAATGQVTSLPQLGPAHVVAPGFSFGDLVTLRTFEEHHLLPKVNASSTEQPLDSPTPSCSVTQSKTSLENQSLLGGRLYRVVAIFNMILDTARNQHLSLRLLPIRTVGDFAKEGDWSEEPIRVPAWKVRKVFSEALPPKQTMLTHNIDIDIPSGKGFFERLLPPKHDDGTMTHNFYYPSGSPRGVRIFIANKGIFQVFPKVSDPAGATTGKKGTSFLVRHDDQFLAKLDNVFLPNLKKHIEAALTQIFAREAKEFIAEREKSLQAGFLSKRFFLKSRLRRLPKTMEKRAREAVTKFGHLFDTAVRVMLRPALGRAAEVAADLSFSAQNDDDAATTEALKAHEVLLFPIQNDQIFLPPGFDGLLGTNTRGRLHQNTEGTTIVPSKDEDALLDAFSEQIAEFVASRLEAVSAGLKTRALEEAKKEHSVFDVPKAVWREGTRFDPEKALFGEASSLLDVVTMLPWQLPLVKKQKQAGDLQQGHGKLVDKKSSSSKTTEQAANPDFLSIVTDVMVSGLREHAAEYKKHYENAAGEKNVQVRMVFQALSFLFGFDPSVVLDAKCENPDQQEADEAESSNGRGPAAVSAMQLLAEQDSTSPSAAFTSLEDVVEVKGPGAAAVEPEVPDNKAAEQKAQEYHQAGDGQKGTRRPSTTTRTKRRQRRAGFWLGDSEVGGEKNLPWSEDRCASALSAAQVLVDHAVQGGHARPRAGHGLRVWNGSLGGSRDSFANSGPEEENCDAARPKTAVRRQQHRSSPFFQRDVGVLVWGTTAGGRGG
ncbi:unnamed protein product [Amoebophrya sp. A120]|nr:unnamed protein product [Amoebophrya sp. A120]|eukprot:GSA120T00009143001.1